MKNRSLLALVATVALFSCGHLSFAQQAAAPATQPAADTETVLTHTRMQTIPAQKYFSLTRQSSLATISADVHETMGKLRQTMKDAGIMQQGPATIVMKGMTQNPQQPISLEIGVPVAEGTKDAGDFKVRDLEAFQCASTIFSGPVAKIAQAYEQVYTDLIGGGHQPADESRQMILYYESPESGNNVMQIMVGVAPQ